MPNLAQWDAEQAGYLLSLAGVRVSVLGEEISQAVACWERKREENNFPRKVGWEERQ